jgi:DNA polymerase-3 subunit delta
MIVVLVGDDRNSILDRITFYKNKLNPNWLSFNFHRFDDNNLEEALDCALSVALGDKHKVVVVDNCKFDCLSDRVSELIPKIPASSYLILVASSIDRRYKATKLLLQHSSVEEFFLISPWRTNDLTKSIARQVHQLKLSLSAREIDYLTTAIGNDTSRSAAELNKLAIYASSNKLTLEAVKMLIPSTTQTSLQLADAVRLGTPRLVIQLLQELLEQGEYPLVIVSTLISQFRTWLIVAEAVEQGINSKEEIARLAKVNNPNRIYYLRQEVTNLSLMSLSVAYSKLFELEVGLKNGAKTDTILTALLGIVRLFKN